MIGIEWLTLERALSWGYVGVGLIVAFIFMRQQEMTDSIRESRKANPFVPNVAVFLLAMIWPVLVFTMVLNKIQGPDIMPNASEKPNDSTSD
jgi:hypothetical protein